MHPVLQLSNLSNAPFSYRVNHELNLFYIFSFLLVLQQIASAAVNGRSRALANIRILHERYRESPTNIRPEHILPVIYATLDPRNIPDLELLDSELPLPDSIIDRVFSSFGTLFFALKDGQVPSAAFSDIWHRFYAWIDFLDTYRDAHLDLQSHPPYDLLTIFVLTTCLLLQHGLTRSFILATPGLQTILSRAWLSFVESDFHQASVIALSGILMGDADAANPTNFQELVAGVDGGIVRLAALVVKHLNLVVASSGPIDEHLCIAGATGIIQQTENNAVFSSALLEQGLATALTALVAKFASAPRAQELLTTCFRVLIAKVQIVPAYPCVHEAFQTGLLEAIILSETHNAGPHLSGNLVYLLRDGLPRAMVYFPAIVEVGRRLEELERLASAPAFQSSPLLSHWRQLVLVVNSNIRCVEYHLHEKRLSFQICYNGEV
ncbi:hypothetical protein B0H11DRAFT_2204299 [Mycena galericulata]|nr:hypothetical protein B0H11DRAFT_2204299 [Mycena galericulata]